MRFIYEGVPQAKCGEETIVDRVGSDLGGLESRQVPCATMAALSKNVR